METKLNKRFKSVSDEALNRFINIGALSRFYDLVSNGLSPSYLDDKEHLTYHSYTGAIIDMAKSSVLDDEFKRDYRAFLSSYVVDNLSLTTASFHLSHVIRVMEDFAVNAKNSSNYAELYLLTKDALETMLEKTYDINDLQKNALLIKNFKENEIDIDIEKFTINPPNKLKLETSKEGLDYHEMEKFFGDMGKLSDDDITDQHISEFKEFIEDEKYVEYLYPLSEALTSSKLIDIVAQAKQERVEYLGDILANHEGEIHEIPMDYTQEQLQEIQDFINKNNDLPDDRKINNIIRASKINLKTYGILADFVTSQISTMINNIASVDKEKAYDYMMDFAKTLNDNRHYNETLSLLRDNRDITQEDTVMITESYYYGKLRNENTPEFLRLFKDSINDYIQSKKDIPLSIINHTALLIDELIEKGDLASLDIIKSLADYSENPALETILDKLEESEIPNSQKIHETVPLNLRYLTNRNIRPVNLATMAPLNWTQELKTLEL